MHHFLVSVISRQISLWATYIAHVHKILVDHSISQTRPYFFLNVRPFISLLPIFLLATSMTTARKSKAWERVYRQRIQIRNIKVMHRAILL